MQIDRFEGGGWSVVMPYSEGRKSFDLPVEFLPAGVSAGEVLEVRIERDLDKTERLVEENRRLLGGLKGGGR